MRKLPFVVFAFAVVVVATSMGSTVPRSAATAPPETLDELMEIIDRLQQRITELEARVAQLEASQSGTAKPAAIGAPVMMVTAVEVTEPDPDVLRKIAQLQSQIETEEKQAMAAEKEAERYISAGDKARSEWVRNRDAENDRKRKACLERAAEHRHKAREMLGESRQLQRGIDDRGPLIRGWNGSRRVVLHTTRSLPPTLRNLVAGDFISWKGAVRQSDQMLEVWTATSLERTSRPAGFIEPPATNQPAL